MLIKVMLMKTLDPHSEALLCDVFYTMKKSYVIPLQVYRLYLETK